MSEQLRIGGTRAASILGVGFQTPLQVWSEMTGKVEREDISEREHIEAGVFLEDAAARWFAHRTGLKVAPSPGLVIDTEFPWLAGTPDRLILADDASPVGVLECKSTGGHARALWSDGEDGAIPLGYQVQLQTYLRVTGLEVGYCAAIVAGQRLRTPQMRRDDAFIRAMLAELERFLEEHVKRDIPPPATAKDLGVLKSLWPKDSGEVVTFEADSPEDGAMIELISASNERRLAEAREEGAKATLQAAMKDATEIVTPSGRATWKAQRSEFKPQPARTVETRVFRIAKRST